MFLVVGSLSASPGSNENPKHRDNADLVVNAIVWVVWALIWVVMIIGWPLWKPIVWLGERGRARGWFDRDPRC